MPPYFLFICNMYVCVKASHPTIMDVRSLYEELWMISTQSRAWSHGSPEN
jgi:hypothetical protein